MNESEAEILRGNLVDCLGGPFPRPCDLKVQTRETFQKSGYRIEALTYEVEPGEAVPSFLLIPDSASVENPAPAIVVCHQHNENWELGKSEPAGLAGDPTHHSGVAFAKLGYVVLCPDALCFEGRQDPERKLKDGDFERFEFLRYVVAGKSMAWKNVLDLRRAVDFLVSRPEVDSSRLGCYGHSMGATHAWLVGPNEPRFKAIAGNCCLPTYSAIHEEKLLHCLANFVPGWVEYGDTPDIAAMIAPRALHLNFGELDDGSPLDHVKAGIERIEKTYADHGVAEKFTHYVELGVGHVLSCEMWKRTRVFFERFLKL